MHVHEVEALTAYQAGRRQGRRGYVRWHEGCVPRSGANAVGGGLVVGEVFETCGRIAKAVDAHPADAVVAGATVGRGQDVHPDPPALDLLDGADEPRRDDVPVVPIVG